MQQSPADVTIEGENIGNVTAERKIGVFAPIFTFHADAGHVVKNSTASRSGNPLWKIGPLGFTTSKPDGCEWTGSSKTPLPFVGGRWHFLQIIKPYRQRVLDSGSPRNHLFNNITGLDSTYAYMPGPFLPDTGAPGGWSGEEEEIHGDSPFEVVNDTVNRLVVHDKYDVYMMYEPPQVGTQDVQWVPLHTLHWEWNTDVTRSGSTWANATGSLGAVTLGAESSNLWCYS